MGVVPWCYEWDGLDRMDWLDGLLVWDDLQKKEYLLSGIQSFGPLFTMY